MCRQLEEVDRELEVHRQTERELHEKVILVAQKWFIHHGVRVICSTLTFGRPTFFWT